MLLSHRGLLCCASHMHEGQLVLLCSLFSFSMRGGQGVTAASALRRAEKTQIRAGASLVACAAKKARREVPIGEPVFFAVSFRSSGHSGEQHDFTAAPRISPPKAPKDRRTLRSTAPSYLLRGCVGLAWWLFRSSGGWLISCDKTGAEAERALMSPYCRSIS